MQETTQAADRGITQYIPRGILSDTCKVAKSNKSEEFLRSTGGWRGCLVDVQTIGVEPATQQIATS